MNKPPIFVCSEPCCEIHGVKTSLSLWLLPFWGHRGPGQPGYLGSPLKMPNNLHSAPYAIVNEKSPKSSTNIRIVETWHWADWPRCTGHTWSLWPAVLVSETGQEDRIMFLMISVLKYNFLFMIFPLTHVVCCYIPFLCAPPVVEQVLVWYCLLICWRNNQIRSKALN